MNLKQRQEIYARLEIQLGRDNQLTKAIEEFSEMITELANMKGKDLHAYSSGKRICEEHKRSTIMGRR